MEEVLHFSLAPYPGLRPFKEDESDIFFGREKQTDQLLSQLGHNRFLAVIGSSGCGKSSLVKAGMLPALKAGFLADAGSRWRICQLRPGDRPLMRLAQMLASADVLGSDRDDEESVAFLQATLRRGPLGLIEIVRSAEELRDANLLVLVDQFEEIFRYRERIAPDEADAFVELLLASTGQRECPIFVVITMRSDYLGECAVFHGLPEAVSASQYLTPRLTREELERAIAGPPRVFGGEVEPKLLNQLINDFGTDPDQLPLLQHALARLWNRTEKSSIRRLLTVDNYQDIGGLSDALSRHGDQILGELTPEQQRIAEAMFRRLSGAGDCRRDVRCPARVGEIAAITGTDLADVINVAEAFSAPDRSFLSVPEGQLTESTVLDISHESLIRQWLRLADWVAAEARSAEMYRRLRDWALRWAQGNAELWRGPDLASAIAWRQREKPGPDWAERYGDRKDFQIAAGFLDASEEAQRVAAATEERERQQQLRRFRRLALTFGLATAGLVLAIVGYRVAFVWDYNVYYEQYVKTWGVPNGIRPISAANLRHHDRSYLIIRRGRWGPVTSMQLVTAAGKRTDLTGTIYGAEKRDKIENKVSRWEYVYDAKGEVAKGEVAYENYFDRHDKRLLSIIYAPTEPGSRATRIAYKTGPNGSLVRDKNSCAAFERYNYSPQGYETLTQYLDQDGVPTANDVGAFGSSKLYDRQGHMLSGTSLAKDGRPLNDETGNAVERVFYDSSGNEWESDDFDAVGKPIDSKTSGYQRYVCESVDAIGNCIEDRAWLADGSPALSGGCHSTQLNYDDRGRIVRSVCLMEDGRPRKSGWAVDQVKYNEDDRPIEDKYSDASGRPALGPLGASRVEAAYDEDGNGTEASFFGQHGEPILSNDIYHFLGNDGYHKLIRKFENGHEIRTEFRGTDGKLIAIDGGYAAIARQFDAHGNEAATSYLGVDNHPIPNRKEGFAVKRTSFDQCGRETESHFFDKNGLPVPSLQGYAGIHKIYDDSNNVVEEVYLNDKGQPTRSVDGYARVTRKFDHNRNLSDEQYFDEHGNKVPVKGVYAEHATTYNDHNALVAEAFLGKRGELVSNDKQWARHTLRYDDKNALVEESYFGAAGQPVLNEDGYARVTFVNDAYGKEIETEYFGVNGKPSPIHGYSKRLQRRNENGNIIEESYFGVNGTPVLSDGGYARLTNNVDDLGRVIGLAFFGLKGEPVIGTQERYHRAQQMLDERGNVIETRLFGTDDKPLKSTEGYTRRVDVYSVHNKLIEESYFGVDSESVASDYGSAQLTYTNNEYGDLTEEKCFGVGGKPVLSREGAWIVRITSDDLGREIDRGYFGLRAEPVVNKVQGYHRVRRVRDQLGNPVDVAAFGIDGRPIEVGNWSGLPQGQRCARVIRRFDATNQQVGAQCFDAAGTLKVAANK